MAARRILTLQGDEPFLRKKAKKIARFGSELKAFADEMVESLHAANGLGLAAPQIGVSERFIVIELPEDYDEPAAGTLFALANPEIVKVSEELQADDEACLSIPGLSGEVERYLKVTVRAQNVKGKTVRIVAEGLLARAFQHEIDHLDGVLFIDHVTDPTKLRRVTAEGESKPIEVSA